MSVRWIALQSIVILAVLLSSLLLEAQTSCSTPAQGNSLVWGCGSANSPSTAYVDAAAFSTGNTVGSSNDFCKIINTVLTAQSGTAITVDARGLTPYTAPPTTAGGMQLACATNPFSGISTASTILLPPNNIQVTKTWILPSNTRLIGELPPNPRGGAWKFRATSALGRQLAQPARGRRFQSAEGLLLDAIGEDGNERFAAQGRVSRDASGDPPIHQANE